MSASTVRETVLHLILRSPYTRKRGYSMLDRLCFIIIDRALTLVDRLLAWLSPDRISDAQIAQVLRDISSHEPQLDPGLHEE